MFRNIVSSQCLCGRLVLLAVAMAVPRVMADTLRVPHEYPTIQAAIDAAEAHCVVLVADGIYSGDGNRDLDFGGKPIVVKSESGPDACILDIQGSELDPHRAFTFQTSETVESVVEGLTIRNGFMSRGGAVVCSRSCSPLFRRCIFEDNTALQSGGAAYCVDSGAAFVECEFRRNHAGSGGAVWRDTSFEALVSGAFADCIFQDNTSSFFGGALLLTTPTLVTDCTFQTNESASGGAIAVGGWYGYVDLQRCDFRANVGASGGAISAGSDAGIVIGIVATECRFVLNLATGGDGGAIITRSPLRLSNCLFVDNHAMGFGGAVWATSWPVAGANLTMTRNSAAAGGGVYLNAGSDRLDNSILWGNAPDQIVHHGSLTVAHSDVEGGWPGPGNIDADPLFASSCADEYGLSAGSPCIDAGDDAAVPAGMTVDLCGLPRFFGTVDMGAHEYQNDACYPDCDASGALDLFDFLCFQNLFALGDPGADCDASGVLDFFDFLCFQNAFAAGCP